MSKRSPEERVPITQEREPEQSQTWVLFAPTDVTTTSYLTETDHSLKTPGRSRVGDLGSLNSAAKSEAESRQSASAFGLDEEDDAELDSLDGHLPGFRSIPAVQYQPQDEQQGSGPVFPGHDGLGSFHLDQPTLGAEAQDHIYQFERFNPRRQYQRRESFDLRQLDVEHDQVHEAEKRQRIEAWRLEHSRVLLGEIQRETRRRRFSQASIQKRPSSNVPSVPSALAYDGESDNMTWHDEDAIGTSSDSEGFFSKVTRRFLRDVVGMDERSISVFLGETVPEDDEDLSSTPRASQTLAWESRQFASREGVAVGHAGEDVKGAWFTCQPYFAPSWCILNLYPSPADATSLRWPSNHPRVKLISFRHRQHSTNRTRTRVIPTIQTNNSDITTTHQHSWQI
ncbi:hypothetical protein NW765_001095 [Fusarium oxysporum]|nr:hypothetical protein NW765_001095 [Fusarium oxysporum]